MSLSYEKLETVMVRDPRLNTMTKREYAILRGAQQINYKRYVSTSVSNSSIQFSCPPSSAAVIVDRKVMFTLPIKLTFSGDAGVGNVLLNPNKDAPRAFPISSSIDTLTASINNTSVSINMADLIQPLMHYNVGSNLKNHEFSTTPSLQDQTQDYSDLYGCVRNPLASWGDCNKGAQQNRGGFSFHIVSNTQTAAVVEMLVTEPIFLSPFFWGQGNHCGFANVTTMDFNINFLAGAAYRMWCHDAVSSGYDVQIQASFQNFTYLIDAQPSLLFQYLTPPETQVIPRDVPITYPYFNIDRYPTDINATIGPGVYRTTTCNNIQLSSIPRRIFIFARQNNQNLYSSSKYTDSFLAIENINIQFNNYSGLLASATKEQLYDICVSSGCDMSWEEWSGKRLYKTNDFTQQYGTVGSVMCLEPGLHLGLNDLEAPGLLGQYNFQVTVTMLNTGNNAIVNPTLYVVVVSEGTFTIEKIASATQNIGVISKMEVLNSKSSPTVTIQEIQDIEGGNWLSGLSKFGSEVGKLAKETKAISRAAKAVAPALGPYGPAAQALGSVADVLGYGEGEGEGVLVGGKRMSKHKLMSRLKRY